MNGAVNRPDEDVAQTEFGKAVVLHSPPAGTRPDAVCGRCCHWSLPIQATQLNRRTPHGVALFFHEWVLWHLHTVLHQQGAPTRSEGEDVDQIIVMLALEPPLAVEKAA